jgi:hypothetical protein
MINEETSVSELTDHFMFEEDEISFTLMLNEHTKIALLEDESDSYKLAAKVSVAKWIVLYKFLIDNGIVKKIHSIGTETCGLCIKGNGGCDLCPIREHTDYWHCQYTPHGQAAGYLVLRNENFEDGLKLVKNELEFVVMIANKINALSDDDNSFIQSSLQQQKTETLDENTSVEEICKKFKFVDLKMQTKTVLQLDEDVQSLVAQLGSQVLAAKVSTAKWLLLYKKCLDNESKKEIDTAGRVTCGFCIVNDSCYDCPICIHTGESYCKSTPHNSATEYLGNEYGSSDNVKRELDFVIMIANKLNALTKEDLQFIISVLQ